MLVLESLGVAICERRVDGLIGFLSCLRKLEPSTEPVNFWCFEIIPGAIANGPLTLLNKSSSRNATARGFEQKFRVK